MPSGVADQFRTLLIGIGCDVELESRLDQWLSHMGIECRYSLAELTNPTRENGEPELVLAIDLAEVGVIAEMVSALSLTPRVIETPVRASQVKSVGESDLCLQLGVK